VIRQLPIDRVHVFGVSAGGPSALYYATKYPTRSLTLWSAVTGSYQPNRESMESLLGRQVLSPYGQPIVSWALSRAAKWMPAATMATFLRTESTLDENEIRKVVTATLAEPGAREEFRTFVDSTTPMTKLYPGMVDELEKMGRSWSAPLDRIDVPVFLVDGSSRPITLGTKTDPAIEQLIVSARTAHPTWGPKKLEHVLSTKHPTVELPARSTISAILKRNGLVQERRPRRRTPQSSFPLTAATEPNVVWCTDFKGK